MPPKRKTKELQQRRSPQDSASTSQTSNKKRKREHTADNAVNTSHASGGENENTDHSVLGGLSGGHRITGEEPTMDPTTTVFKVPFNDKYIICEHREKEDHDEDSGGKVDSVQSSPALVFTHGAGGGISNPATASFVEGFSHIDPVVCFQGTMNLQSRVKTFHAVLEHQREQQAKNKKKSKSLKLALGGRSMGARAAVMTANAISEDAKSSGLKVHALVLASYPLVGGKNNDVRDKILKQIPAATDVLFVTGGHDAMCDIARLRGVRSEMAANTWLIVVENADHGMSLKNKQAMEALRLETGAIAAEWLRSRDRGKRYCNVSWNDAEGEITGGDWVEEDED